MNRSSQFRAHLNAAQGRPLIAPTIYNAQTAQLVEQAGFHAAWLGGSGITNTLFGMPDVGYLNLTDMEYVLKRAVDASNIGILADIDDGYGSFLNVMYSIRVVEAAGAVGVSLDDQLSHRTPYQGTTVVVPADELVGKIKAAVDARKDENFLVMARTDSFWSLGIDAAIERINLYAEAGADMGFITGVFAHDTMTKVKAQTKIKHRMMSRTPDDMSLEQMRGLGFDLVALGQLDPMRAGTLAMSNYYEQLFARGNDFKVEAQKQFAGTRFDNWWEYTGLSKVGAIEGKYLPADELKQRRRQK
jgi:2-methylisocitrate lyase-like PEP mutase family enzyme